MRWSQGPRNGACGIRHVFCLKCSHCCVYLSFLELLQPVTPGNPLGQLWVRAGYPNQETKRRWSDHRSHQRRYAISSTHLNDQGHFLNTHLLEWYDMLRQICSKLRLLQCIHAYSVICIQNTRRCLGKFGKPYGNNTIVPNDLNSM